MKQQSFNRNELISFLQIFGIILVVIGHSFTSENSIMLNRIIYSFHMPLFMFISGFLFVNTMLKRIVIQTTFFQEFIFFLKKKFIRIIIPYILISTIVFFPKILLSKYSLRPIGLSVYSYLEMLVYPGKNVIIFFWFLPTLFIISILSYFAWNYYAKSLHIKGWIINLIFFFLICFFNPFHNIMILNIGGVAHYFFYFMLGIFYFQYQYKINTFLFNHTVIKLSVFALVHVIVVILLLYSSYYVHVVTFIAILGIVESITIGLIYIQKGQTFLCHLYGSSYSIYLFSWFPQVIIQFFLLKYVYVPWYLAALLSTLLGIYIPFSIYIVLNKLKSKNKVFSLISMGFGN